MRKDLALCTIDGTTYSIMVGCGEQYLPAFVLALGMGQIASGLVATVPMLAGALLQLVTPWAVRRLGSYRKWVVLTAALQGASFLPLVFGALAGMVPGWLVFACATVYWASGLGGGPAWTTWMSLLIPVKVRPKYFARRARYCHIGVMAGLTTGAAVFAAQRDGSIFGGDSGGTLAAFAVLFGLAFLCRAVSTALLTRQSEPRPLPIRHTAVAPLELARRMLHGHDGRLLAYAAAAGVALQFCQPFITPYFIVGLKLQGFELGVLLAAGFAGRIALLGVFGRIAQRLGPLRLLWIGALGLVPAAALPLGSDSLAYLCFAQFVSGASIAAHELALFLMYLETIREDERTSLLTLFNVLNSLASVAGSVMGGLVLRAWGTEGGMTAYVALFLGGMALRLAALPVLARVRRQGEPVGPATDIREIGWVVQREQG